MSDSVAWHTAVALHQSTQRCCSKPCRVTLHHSTKSGTAPGNILHHGAWQGNTPGHAEQGTWTRTAPWCMCCSRAHSTVPGTCPVQCRPTWCCAVPLYVPCCCALVQSAEFSLVQCRSVNGDVPYWRARAGGVFQTPPLLRPRLLPMPSPFVHLVGTNLPLSSCKHRSMCKCRFMCSGAVPLCAPWCSAALCSLLPWCRATACALQSCSRAGSAAWHQGRWKIGLLARMGGRSSPSKKAGVWGLVKGLSWQASPKRLVQTLMTTHHLVCKTAWKKIGFPDDTSLVIVLIILSQLCWGTSGAPPTSAVGPSGSPSQEP